jgi:hypothetical protein
VENEPNMSTVSSHSVTAILSLQTLSTCLSSTIGQYIYAAYLQIYPFPSNGTSNFTTVSSISSFSIVKAISENITQCVTSDIISDNDAQAWAQQRSADLFFWTNLFNSCPLIVMTYLLGLYTPKLGKRFVLILPILGIGSQFAIWLAIMYLHLPEYWWYIAAVISGLSGSSGVLSMTVICRRSL